MDCTGTRRTTHRGGWASLICGFILAMTAGLLLAAPSARAQFATGPDQGIAGYWDWGAGASGNIVTIWGNGTGRGGEGNALKWTLVDPIAKQYRLEWSNGFTDMATLSVDGNTLLIVNNEGIRFVSTRHPGTSSAQANPPPAPAPQPPAPPKGGAVAGGALPQGRNSFDSTSVSSGDPFNGGTWSNAQNGHAFAQRLLMPPVCIGGLALESAGSDMSTRGARISIELTGPYGAHFMALDLRGVAVNRDFSPGGSGKVVPPQSATFPPFATSRIEVRMSGHGWFLMKGLRFAVVPCP
jgi:hypothetical protein